VSHIKARIEGETRGQIAVGTNIVQVKAEAGASVTVVPPEEAPKIHPVALPVYVRPRDFPDLLDRRDETRHVEVTLRDGLPVELYGAPGSGKTSLMRHLAYSVDAAAFPAGIVCLPTLGTASDLIQALFDALFEADVRLKPTEMQIRRLLGEQQALVLVDDVELGGTELDELLDSAPKCAFLLCSSQRRLWREGRAFPLGGLPTDEAVELVELEFGRSLDESERDAARRLAVALEGFPLRIRQSVALTRDENRVLADVVAELESETVSSERRVLLALSADELSVVRALALTGHSSFPAEWIGPLSGIADPSAVLEDLERRGVVESLSPRYRLTGALGEEVRSQEDLSEEIDRAAELAEQAAEQSRDEPEPLLAGAEALVSTVDLAAAHGRPEQVVKLARALDATLLLSGRWGAWRRVLDAAAAAASSLGDAAIEGWATHQLGTCALVLGETEAAGELLARALALREQAGDSAGAELTRQNASHLASAAPTAALSSTAAVGPATPAPRPGWGRVFSLPRMGFGALVLVGGAAAGFAIGSANKATTTVAGPTRQVTLPVTISTELTKPVTVVKTISGSGFTQTIEATATATVTQPIKVTATRVVTLRPVTDTVTTTVTVIRKVP
jgi:hypothetical protein